MRKDAPASGFASSDLSPRLLRATANITPPLLPGTPDGLIYQSAAAIPVTSVSAPQNSYAADFNGDGKMDLAVLDANGLQVLLGNGTGALTPSFTYKLPNKQQTGYLLAADFNHDGKLDLAFSVTGSAGKIGILLGNGDGTFQKVVFTSALSFPNQFAVADFNGDGNPDLVIQLVQGNSVAVALGNGDGTFGAPMLNQVGSGGSPLGYVFTGDFNGDGHTDILALGAQACVLLGAGDGTFTVGPCTSTAGGTGVGIVGDFNQDGIPDVADVETTSPYSVDILLGSGGGNFQSPAKYPISFEPAGLQTASLRNDGILDIVVASNSGLFLALAGNGDGTFNTPGPLYVQGGMGAEFALADFTGDSIADAVFAEAGNSTITLAAGNGDTTFQAAQAFPAGTYLASYAGVAAADFNGDGYPDAATVDSTGVTVTLSNGNGTFQPPVTGIPSGTTLPGGILAGDFNGDGITDLAVLGKLTDGNSGVYLLFGNGNGTFQVPVTIPAGLNPVKFVSADFNQDGNLDFAVLNNCAGPQCKTGDSVTILLGDGHGNFTSAGPYNVGQPGPLTIIAGNFNSDAYPDLAVLSKKSNGTAYVSILLNNGDGTFGAPSKITFGSTTGVIGSLVSADMTNDGNQDLVVTAEEVLHADTALFVLLGHDDGTFTFPGIKSKLGYGNTPTVTDANGDGIPDLLYPALNSFRFLIGNGDGTFQLAPTNLPSVALNSIIVSDLNNDGKPDLLAVGNSGVVGGTLYLEDLLNMSSAPVRRKRP